MRYTRRSVLAGLGLAGLGAAMPPVIRSAAASSLTSEADSSACPFRLALINDEITQDFEKACHIVAGDFRLGWIELRSMWDKNLTNLPANQIPDPKKTLHKHNLPT